VNAAKPSAGYLLAQCVVLATQQLVRAVRDGLPATTVRRLMRERRSLLGHLARNVDDQAGAGSLAALRAAVAESDRTLGALLG
jgi:hypothetical protein